MNGPVREQRNAYKGSPPRSWIRVTLVAASGTEQGLELIADTGCPHAVIVSQDVMNQYGRRSGLDISSNLGLLSGGWLRVVIPDVSCDAVLPAYASDGIVASTKLSSPDFEGLTGLLLLRRLVYGGDSESFWVQEPSRTP